MGSNLTYRKTRGADLMREHVDDRVQVQLLSSIYLFTLQHPLSSFMCSCAVNAAVNCNATLPDIDV